MLAEANRKSNNQPAIHNVLVASLPRIHTMSASIEAAKFYTGCSDSCAKQGLATLPWLAYTTTKRDVALAVQSDLENFGFNCKLELE